MCFNLIQTMYLRRPLVFFRRFYSNAPSIHRESYPLESYNVVTEDGYILTLHRIISRKNTFTQKSDSLRYPILLQHGLWSSTEDWIAPGPGYSLGYLLSDLGFDVWLGNSRGNKYSRRHLKLNPDKNSKEYWDFSWHEMGYYDLPAMIELILNVSKFHNLFYIGHSQGSTIFFVMAATRPELNKYVKSMFALAPVAYLKNMKSGFLHRLASLADPLLDMLNTRGYYKLTPGQGLITIMDKLLLMNADKFQAIVPLILDNFSTYATEDAKKSFFELVVAHIKSGASFKSLAHFAQCTRHEASFCLFDYGPDKNMKVYGQSVPPEYNLQNISTPLHFFYSEGDWITSVRDVEKLYETIPNKGSLIKVSVPRFNHLDFIWASNAKEAFLYDIVENIRSSHLENDRIDALHLIHKELPMEKHDVSPTLESK